MVFQSPGDVAFEVFSFPIYFYGIVLAFACLLGVSVSYLLLKKTCTKEIASKIIDFSPYVLIAGIFGARLYYCFVNFHYYSHNILEVFDIREGGLSIHGGIFFGIAALITCAVIYKIPVLRLLDVFACGTMLAQSVGRWGNFFNSEAFGYPTNLPWKLFVPIADRPIAFINHEFFHPTFLYESILDFFVFIILLIVYKKYGKSIQGLTLCMYLFLYSVVRIFVENMRVDSVLSVHGLPIAQIISVITIIFTLLSGLFVVYFNRKKS